MIPAEEFHLTLVFLGATTAERQACFEAAASELRAPPVILTLDRIGHWPRPQVLWAGAGRVCAALQSLVSGLQDHLQACGFTPEARPYVPHVTLLRRCRHAPDQGAMAALDWQFDAFCLVESVSGGGPRYRIRRRWPLGT